MQNTHTVPSFGMNVMQGYAMSVRQQGSAGQLPHGISAAPGYGPKAPYPGQLVFKNRAKTITSDRLLTPS